MAICVGLVGVAVWLIRVHWEHWQEVDAAPNLPAREREHLKRRHRRRIQTSTMLGFVGIAILAGRLFPAEDPSIVTILYWTGVALLVLWMALLALADMIATRVYYGVERRKFDGERAKLEAQLRRLEAEVKGEGSGNGASKGPADAGRGNVHDDTPQSD